MRIHAIQHVPYEGVGLIGDWAEQHGHELTVTHATTERYPGPEEFDFLVIMGGPMDADDEIASPWLVIEKHFIAEAIADGKLVLGICLGAQIIAEVLGGRVRRGVEREIGWYPVTRTEAGLVQPLFSHWPDTVVVGHWHSDTFDMPMSMQPVLSSEVTPNQAFVFDGHVVGLQFHLEWDEESLAALLEASGDELVDRTTFVMSTSEIADEIPDRVPVCLALLYGLLDGMAEVGPRQLEEVAQ